MRTTKTRTQENSELLERQTLELKGAKDDAKDKKEAPTAESETSWGPTFPEETELRIFNTF